MSNKNTSRRGFFKAAVGSVITLGLVPLFKRAGFEAFAEELPPLDVKDPVASSLGYIVDGAKVDVKKWTKKAGADGKTQSCENCMFYTGLDKKKGKCQIFPGRSVTAKGWCNSWSKKA